MEEAEFKDAEARFIARYILKGLHEKTAGISLFRKKLKIENSHIRILESDDFLRTVKNIENIEDTWYYRIKSVFNKSEEQRDEEIRLWSVPSMTAKVLGYLVLYTNSRNILEVGTSAGYSTIHLANAAKHINGKIFTIELHNKKIELAEKNIKDSCLKNITLIKGEASSILDIWDLGKIDFVFLDADKRNYSRYLDQLLPLMKKDSIIIADNINDFGHKMGDFIQRVSGSHFPYSRSDRRVKSFYIAQLDNGLLIIKKITD